MAAADEEILLVNASCSVKIFIKDRPGVIGRYLEGGYCHGQHPYGLKTEHDILEHLAYNAISNGVERAQTLDGWSDLAHDAATMHVGNVEIE